MTRGNAFAMTMIAQGLPQQADLDFQANLYDDPNPTRQGLHRARRAWVEAAIVLNLPLGGTALEVGVGCGIYTHFLSRLGARVTALDNNPAFVVAVSGVGGVTAVLADATAPLTLEEHDLVLCSEVLEHVPRAASVATLRNLRRALKPGGRLILTTPQRFASVELVARLLRFPPALALARAIYGSADELGHVNLLTERQLRAQLAQAGLAIERSTRFGFYLPVVAEFGGTWGSKLLRRIEGALVDVPLLRNLIWTQAYVLGRADAIG